MVDHPDLSAIFANSQDSLKVLEDIATDLKELEDRLASLKNNNPSFRGLSTDRLAPNKRTELQGRYFPRFQKIPKNKRHNRRLLVGPNEQEYQIIRQHLLTGGQFHAFVYLYIKVYSRTIK